ncbi:retroviral-like aspartic protease family protein [Parerythrobacter lacustris]|uniref:Retroviral-like aspartic protease family protein n=1 Tax=Parerythrobacter lacustris TaxID=2969984 RepID=A0ABT1XTV8_9SPHN|nr:retroviral-like aspartic protease family protein [Parerythrobacter lacustris]MCR2834689.1 retroviral-like aspartic protease family protein [Parerythrobacter lacustris]
MVFTPLLAAALASTNANSAIPVPQEVAEPALQAETAGPEPQLVEVNQDFYERMTVPVTIDGQGPFRFMIDTGSQATVVTEGLKDKLGLELIGTATLVGMASRVPVEIFEVNGLQFASRTFDNIEAPMLKERNIGADGILGLDSLQDLRVMIDFRTDTIAVDDAKALGGNQGFEIIVRARHRLGRLIITQAKIDGVTTAIIVDTGAQNSIGNRALQRKLRARNQAEFVTTDVNGVDLVGNLSLAKSLDIQGLRLQNLSIAYADAPAFEALGLDKRPALILGMRDLRLFDRIAIDFESRRILFDVPSGASGNQGLYRNTFFPSRL